MSRATLPQGNFYAAPDQPPRHSAVSSFFSIINVREVTFGELNLAAGEDAVTEAAFIHLPGVAGVGVSDGLHFDGHVLCM